MRPLLKWFGLVAGICIALALFGYGGYKAYCKWQPERLAKRAQKCIEQEDYKNAALLIKHAFELNPNSLSASRVSADLTDKLGLADALLWRQKVVLIKPGSTPDILAWAKTALRLNQTAVAQKTLAMVKEADRTGLEYHIVSGDVAVALENFADASMHYQNAVQTAPADGNLRFKLACAQIRVPDILVQNRARADLEKLTSDEQFRLPALRMLVQDLAGKQQLAEALRRSREVEADSHAIFSDHLLHIHLLHETQDPEFSAALHKLQGVAGKTPREAGLVINWMGSNGLARDAVEWAGGLPAEILSTSFTGQALATCYTALRNWSGLALLAKNGSWNQLEFLRHLFLARALLETGDRIGFQANWSSAVTAAAKNGDSIKRLAEIAQSWNWQDEVRELLWTASKDPMISAWALQRLYQNYSEAHDTRGLHQVAGRMVQLDPSNDMAQNNFAMLSLLLKTNIDRSATLAQELYNKNPQNPGIVSTRAFAVYMQGHADEALQIMNTLKPAELRQPSIAAYYGILLAANGVPGKAAEYLDLAKAANLLPEEEEMVAEASRGSK